MVIQSDFYPGAGYQQRGYVVQQQVQQQEEDWDATDDDQNDDWIVQTKPNPSITTPYRSSHQIMYDGSYVQQQDGWYGKSKPENGRHGATDQYYTHGGSGGQVLPCNFKEPHQYSNYSPFKNPTTNTDPYKAHRETYSVPVAANRVQEVRSYERSSVYPRWVPPQPLQPPPLPAYEEQNRATARTGACCEGFAPGSS
ncbi:hypothetical protein F0562_033253 [Nyssa sinensis]|uniref:Uncharacterized protein n=1 Tax=Nyssa sinensis TaxID=561372 RepID=A0A5J5ASI1_9ASTE|nr:hypothetical protein F0562_033253 [Nyssa sinensis]